MNPKANAHSLASNDDTSKWFIFCSFPGKEHLDNFASQIPLSHWVVEKLIGETGKCSTTKPEFARLWNLKVTT